MMHRISGSDWSANNYARQVSFSENNLPENYKDISAQEFLSSVQMPKFLSFCDYATYSGKRYRVVYFWCEDRAFGVLCPLSWTTEKINEEWHTIYIDPVTFISFEYAGSNDKKNYFSYVVAEEIDGEFYTPEKEISVNEFLPNFLNGGFNRISISDGKITLFNDTNSYSMYFDGEPKYSVSGCGHNYIELRPEECRKLGIDHFGNCWHVYRCEKCGDIYSVDSSG